MNQKKIVFTKYIFRKTPVKMSVLVQLKTCRLTAFPKAATSQMFFLIVKFNRRSFLQNTAVRLLLISWNIFNVSLALSAINQFSHTGCLGLSEKRSKCLLWKYLSKTKKRKSMVIFCGSGCHRCRNSHPDVIYKKGALEYLAKLIEKHPYRRLFLIRF